MYIYNVSINEQVNHDKINTFLNCRYVSAPEALWQIFEYPISEMSHTIIRLQVHLPDNQMIYFVVGGEQAALDRATQCDTHLTAWFNLNAENRHDTIHMLKFPSTLFLIVNIVNGK